MLTSQAAEWWTIQLSPKNIFRGEKLLSWLKHNKISQRQFAREVKVSVPYLNDLVHGKRNPSEETFNRIFAAIQKRRKP